MHHFIRFSKCIEIDRQNRANHIFLTQYAASKVVFVKRRKKRKIEFSQFVFTMWLQMAVWLCSSLFKFIKTRRGLHISFFDHKICSYFIVAMRLECDQDHLTLCFGVKHLFSSSFSYERYRSHVRKQLNRYIYSFSGWLRSCWMKYATSIKLYIIYEAYLAPVPTFWHAKQECSSCSNCRFKQ